MTYRIEIKVLGLVVHYLETEDYKAAREYYLDNNYRFDCWTQLFVDGKEIPKKQADDIMLPENNGYWFRQQGREWAAETNARKKKK